MDIRWRHGRCELLDRPTPTDPEVAETTFQQHLDDLWASGKPDERGWRRKRLDPLHEIIVMPARREGFPDEDYFVELGGRYYDAWPPTASFINPDDCREAQTETRWWPQIVGAENFGFGYGVQFPSQYTTRLGEPLRQLICFTATAQYYMVDHAPPEHTVWRQGEHRLARTLGRLHELLGSPYYLGPSG